MEDKKSAELILSQLNLRLAEIEAAQAEDAKREDGDTPAADGLRESVLSVSKVIYVKIELSWGGPSDYYDLAFTPEGELIGGTYHFVQWFDPAEIALTEEQAQTVYDFYLYGDVEAVI